MPTPPVRTQTQQSAPRGYPHPRSRYTKVCQHLVAEGSQLVVNTLNLCCLFGLTELLGNCLLACVVSGGLDLPLLLEPVGEYILA